MSWAARGRASRRALARMAAKRSRSSEQAVDLVGEHGQVIAADRRSFLEQVVEFRSSWPGIGLTTTKTSPARSALGGRQTSRLADHQVGSGHVLVHRRGVAMT